MNSFFTVFMVLAFLGSGHDIISPQEGYRTVLTFEAPHSIGGRGGWGGGPPETLFLDSLIVHGGRYAGRIERDSENPGQSSVFTMSLPVTFSGDTLEFHGWLRTDNVTGFAGLWLREDGKDGVVEFDNMQQQNLAGSTEWTHYRIALPINTRARSLLLGTLLVGEGTVWVDDLELKVDGRPLAEAPPFVPDSNPVEADSEFDDGSRIETESLSSLQVENLAILGKVWGFTKYHHPRITAGEVNWDYELFRITPSVLRSTNRVSAMLVISEWLASLGDPDPAEPNAEPPTDAYLLPEISWIHDSQTLGMVLCHRLDLIYRNRSTDGKHYYVGHNPGVGNPDFSNEASYSNMPLPDAGFRLLAVFRLWNIIEYWFPYRDVIGEDWSNVLAEFIPRVMATDSHDEYRLTLMQMTARIHDTHANTWGVLNLRPPQGSAQIPVSIRFIEGEAVVSGFIHPDLGPASGLEMGDVIRTIDGCSIDSLVVAWEPYYAASNRPTRLRDIGRALTRGDAGPVRVTGERSTTPFEVTTERIPLSELDLAQSRIHDLPGETFQRLTEEVAYLKLSSVEKSETADYIRQASGSKVLVLDIRNYPSAFMVFSLGGHLVREVTPFARFTRADPTNPGAFLMSEPVALQPVEPYYPGKVVILLDEVSQSQAEYTAMAFRTAANAIVVGSTTAGADGNISPIPLPGGFSSMISGIGVFYPDGKPTQRIGIIPDLEVRPTIDGIRAGRDEVLEAGIGHALGRVFRLPPH